MFRATLKQKGSSTSSTFFDDQNTGTGTTVLSAAKLSQQAGKAGTFTFTLPPVSPYAHDFVKASSYVDLYRNNDIIFAGRVYSTTKNLDSDIQVICEGMLAVFNDTVLAPGEYAVPIADLLTAMLTSHNSQVGAECRVYLGNCTVIDNYVYRKYENYAKTLDRLQTLASNYQAYMSVRRNPQDGLLYLDFLEEYTKQASQTVDFGSNMLTYTEEDNLDNYISVIFPLGAELEDEETGEPYRVTIESVNDGVKYLESATGIAAYGRITGIVEWPDVTTPSQLKAKATGYLQGVQNTKKTIKVTAVDLAKAGSSIQAWSLGDVVTVNAQALGIEAEAMTVLKYQLDLLNPQNNKLTLGNDRAGFVSSSQTAISQATQGNKGTTIINNNVTEADEIYFKDMETDLYYWKIGLVPIYDSGDNLLGYNLDDTWIGY